MGGKGHLQTTLILRGCTLSGWRSMPEDLSVTFRAAAGEGEIRPESGWGGSVLDAAERVGGTPRAQSHVGERKSI
jgi:hypothetical protein